MEGHRSRGLCFNCNEKIILIGSNRWRTRWIRGIARFGTDNTCIWGTINGVPFFVLVDSGSTHCYLDTNVANKLKVPIKKPVALWVTVANGKNLPWTRVCRNVNIRLLAAPMTKWSWTRCQSHRGAIIPLSSCPKRWDWATMRWYAWEGSHSTQQLSILIPSNLKSDDTWRFCID